MAKQAPRGNLIALLILPQERYEDALELGIRMVMAADLSPDAVIPVKDGAGEEELMSLASQNKLPLPDNQPSR